MSLLPKLPGTSFSRYLAQERNKELKKQGYHSAGIFDDVEAHAPDITDTKPYPDLHHQLMQKLKAAIGPSSEHLQLVYRGTIDGRNPGQPYPYGEAPGYFYIVEHGGSIGSSIIKPGDVLVRIDGFSSDWMLITKDEPKWDKELELAKEISLKHFDALKQELKKMPSPKTKAAPGPQKRKVILEDD
jgi:hypothetical protein